MIVPAMSEAQWLEEIKADLPFLIKSSKARDNKLLRAALKATRFPG